LRSQVRDALQQIAGVGKIEAPGNGAPGVKRCFPIGKLGLEYRVAARTAQRSEFRKTPERY
jgi:hypothetical protein